MLLCLPVHIGGADHRHSKTRILVTPHTTLAFVLGGYHRVTKTKFRVLVTPMAHHRYNPGLLLCNQCIESHTCFKVTFEHEDNMTIVTFPSLCPPLIPSGCPVHSHLLGEHMGELHQQPRLEHPVGIDLPFHLLILRVRLLHAVFCV